MSSRGSVRGCYSQCISNTRIYGYGNHCVLLVVQSLGGLEHIKIANQ